MIRSLVSRFRLTLNKHDLSENWGNFKFWLYRKYWYFMRPRKNLLPKNFTYTVKSGHWKGGSISNFDKDTLMLQTPVVDGECFQCRCQVTYNRKKSEIDAFKIIDLSLCMVSDSIDLDDPYIYSPIHLIKNFKVHPEARVVSVMRFHQKHRWFGLHTGQILDYSNRYIPIRQVWTIAALAFADKAASLKHLEELHEELQHYLEGSKKHNLGPFPPLEVHEECVEIAQEVCAQRGYV